MQPDLFHIVNIYTTLFQRNSKMKTGIYALLIFLNLAMLSNHSMATERAATHYPIILVGGSFINFDSLGPINFFYKIPSALANEGANVFVSTVSAVNSPDIRGEQLARQVEDIIAITGKDKVNLISISSGGLTARYAASVYPDLIASVTTINGGHGGTPIADLAVSGIESLPVFLQKILWKTGNAITKIVAFIAGDNLPMDTKALALSHTTKESEKFTERHPEGKPTEFCGQAVSTVAENGVRYFAFAGSHYFTNWLDPADYLLAVSQRFVGEANEGVFGRCSSHWGNTIRDDLYLNHLDEANHLFGIRSPRLNPLELFIGQANRLKNLGL